MRVSAILGSCVVVVLGAAAVNAVGCGDSSSSGGAGGTAAVTTAAATSAAKTAASSTKATSTPTATATTDASTGADTINCNPVHDTECDVANGDDCDLADPSGFVCYLGPSTIDLCAPCAFNGADPPFCKDGSTCFPKDAQQVDGFCVKFCCTDADCGGGAGSCNRAANGTYGIDPAIGVCGTPDATNIFIATPLCSPTVPAVPPSNGTCYTTPP